ncbi:MAG: hypothetical protein H7267_12915 [Sandarakinorhabdus sp.]|nr:hypothetical protein [Sandarakinorhabdus sp.]
MRPQTLRALRQFHLYIGVFFAPAIVFFAISGGLQSFRLQQASGWNGAPPPLWMAWMASVHVEQAKFVAKPEKPRPPIDPAKAAERAAHQKAVLPMKIFTVALAAALALSALLGAAIALSMKSTRRISVVMLIAGAVLPILLLA